MPKQPLNWLQQLFVLPLLLLPDDSWDASQPQVGGGSFQLAARSKLQPPPASCSACWFTTRSPSKSTQVSLSASPGGHHAPTLDHAGPLPPVFSSARRKVWEIRGSVAESVTSALTEAEHNGNRSGCCTCLQQCALEECSQVP